MSTHTPKPSSPKTTAPSSTWPAINNPSVPGRLCDLEMATHRIKFGAPSEELVALGQLADDLIRRVPPAFLR